MADNHEQPAGHDLITADELSQRLRVTTETVQGWTNRGLIPCYRPTRAVVRYDLQEVLASLRRAPEGLPNGR